MASKNTLPDGDSSKMTSIQSHRSDGLPRTLETYTFPQTKLRRTLKDKSKTPLVLVACGSFSPPTFLHLRLFELAADFVRDQTNFECIGGLVNAKARIDMCNLATKDSEWVDTDDFEALNPEYVPTATVLDHIQESLEQFGGIRTEDGETKQVRVALLAGADLIATFAVPGLWAQKDLDHILGDYGCFILERTNTNIDESLQRLEPYINHIWLVNQPIMNDVSSTKIRLFLKKDMSIRYLIPTSVIDYIYDRGLFNVGDESPNGHAKRQSGAHLLKETPKSNGQV